jgi:hypothetical protein
MIFLYRYSYIFTLVDTITLTGTGGVFMGNRRYDTDFKSVKLCAWQQKRGLALARSNETLDHSRYFEGLAKHSKERI